MTGRDKDKEAGQSRLIWRSAVGAQVWGSARQVVAAMAVSRERGITVRAAQNEEARRIARRMLWFALAGHIGTAAAAAVIAYFSAAKVGYYFAGFYLLSAVVRPAISYFAHLRERIKALTRESTHPREDVISLKLKVDCLAGALRDLQAELRQAQRGVTDDLRRVESALAGDITHARQLLTPTWPACRMRRPRTGRRLARATTSWGTGSTRWSAGSKTPWTG